jgi:hypothetical protein
MCLSINLLSDTIITLEDVEKSRLIFVPVPRRSFLCISGDARHILNHGIFPHHINGRRVVVTMREPSMEFQVYPSYYRSNYYYSINL